MRCVKRMTYHRLLDYHALQSETLYSNMGMSATFYSGKLGKELALRTLLFNVLKLRADHEKISHVRLGKFPVWLQPHFLYPRIPRSDINAVHSAELYEAVARPAKTYALAGIKWVHIDELPFDCSGISLRNMIPPKYFDQHAGHQLD